jgi:hypothetical protein
MSLHSRDEYQILVSASKDSSPASIEIKQKTEQLNVLFFKKKEID